MQKVNSRPFERALNSNIKFRRQSPLDDWTAAIEISLPGVYHYDCEFETQDRNGSQGAGCFLVTII